MNSPSTKSDWKRPRYEGTTTESLGVGRYLYYTGRIQAMQLDYTDAYTKLMQSTRKAPARKPAHSARPRLERVRGFCSVFSLSLSLATQKESFSSLVSREQANTALGFRRSVQQLTLLVQLLMGEIPDRSMFGGEGMRTALAPYLELARHSASELTGIRFSNST